MIQIYTLVKSLSYQVSVIGTFNLGLSFGDASTKALKHLLAKSFRAIHGHIVDNLKGFSHLHHEAGVIEYFRIELEMLSLVHCFQGRLKSALLSTSENLSLYGQYTPLYRNR